MLRLKNICKYYKEGNNKRIILDNITIDFNNNGLVFILGASGSGKSTLLNIIGGNLKCDSGEIWLDNICISKLNDKKLNGYRENIVSNIFQDYNLIDYMSVWDNIIIRYNKEKSKDNIISLLKELGIYDKRRQLVSKLSGGEKQRVAIARALVNDPDIILADEPTGALDSANGIQVMEILKKISKNKLVIVVSHDNYLANKYASRIINIKDGKCDYYPVVPIEENINYRKHKNRPMFKLAFKNLISKSIRTIITSFCVSLGIVSMFMIINLYNNFSNEIKTLEKELVTVFPIKVLNGEYEQDDNKNADDKIIIKDKDTYKNKITEKYISYLKNIDEIDYLTYNYDLSMPVISSNYKIMDNKYLNAIPSNQYILDNYDIVYGRNIQSEYELLLKIDDSNRVSSELLHSFGIDNDIEYNDIIGKKVKIITSDLYYVKNSDYYIVNTNYKDMYDKSDIELTIVGIIKEREVIDNESYIYYDSLINDIIINRNNDSDIVHDQLKVDYNLLNVDLDKDTLLSYLGYNTLPNGIDIYVDSIRNKQIVIDKLDEYNKNNDKIIYVDAMDEVISTVKQFILIIGVILILFSMVAIIISSLMVGILTSVRVLEFKKEIGILRSLGTSKKEIKQLFNIENMIIGLLASIIGISIIYIIRRPIDITISNYIGIDNIFNINYKIFFLVMFINLFIVKMAGSIPAIRASKLEIVKCIYNR